MITGPWYARGSGNCWRFSPSGNRTTTRPAISFIATLQQPFLRRFRSLSLSLSVSCFPSVIFIYTRIYCCMSLVLLLLEILGFSHSVETEGSKRETRRGCVYDASGTTSNVATQISPSHYLPLSLSLSRWLLCLFAQVVSFAQPLSLMREREPIASTAACFHGNC